MREFPRQFLDVGKSVYFGQNIQEVEILFGVPAVDNPLQIARKGIDRKISTPEFSLEFDQGKLHSIEFRQLFRFDYPPQPFAEEWANFASIGGACIEKSMTRDRFADYVRSWEIRAKQSGAISVDSPDLAEREFRYSFEKDSFCDMFHLALGPSRRAGGGGIWASGWTAFFSMPGQPDWDDSHGSELRTLTASCDEFNTVARRVS